jgi:hypothetical protein
MHIVILRRISNMIQEPPRAQLRPIFLPFPLLSTHEADPLHVSFVRHLIQRSSIPPEPSRGNMQTPADGTSWIRGFTADINEEQAGDFHGEQHLDALKRHWFWGQ